MKKELAVFIFLFFLSISFVNAVWWNPFSWFEKEIQFSETEFPEGVSPESSCIPGSTPEGNCPIIYESFEPKESCSGYCYNPETGNSLIPEGNCYNDNLCALQREDANGLDVYECVTMPGAYADCDGDGYPGPGLPWDCDDFDDSKYRWLEVYTDLDGDGYAKDFPKVHYGGYSPDGVIDDDDKTKECIGDYVPEGYTESISSSIPDCDDIDNEVNPGTEEICNDKKDNNCNGKSDCGDDFCSKKECDTNKKCCGGECISVFEVDFGGSGQCKICDSGEIKNKPNGISSCTDTNGNLIEYDSSKEAVGCCGGSCGKLQRYYWDNDGDTFPNKDNFEDVCSFEELSHDNDAESEPPPRWYTDGPFDCDDTNADLWQYLLGYVDGDGDGDGIIPPQKVCSGVNIPEGYSFNALDCNDANPTINSSGIYPAFNKDDLCKKCGSEISTITNPITGEDMTIHIGKIGFDRFANGDRNCYQCRPNGEDPENDLIAGGSVEFIENNPMGDGDCFYCNPYTSSPELDPTSEPINLYYHDGKLTNEKNSVKNPLPSQGDCDCTTFSDTGEYVQECCYNFHAPATSDSLIMNTYSDGELRPDCKTCDWLKAAYQFGKSASEQARHKFDENEDPLNGGNNCSYCFEITGLDGYKEAVLWPDPTDSRFLGMPPAGGEEYYCKQCSLTEPVWIVNDSDKRVHGVPYDQYLETTCKRCEKGVLKNEKNLEISNWCPSCPDTLSGIFKSLYKDKLCCGGEVFDAAVEGCCPTVITGDSLIDDYEGEKFTPGSGILGQKCCRENIITANPSPSLEYSESYWNSLSEEEKQNKLTSAWRVVIKDSITYTGETFSTLWNYSKYIVGGSKDGKVQLSNTSRVVVNNLDKDYCNGDGLGKKVVASWNGLAPEFKIALDDKCTPCQPSGKANTIPSTAITKLGSNLGYTAWLGGLAGSFLLKYKDLDSIIGLRGYPRYNRVCFESSISIPFIGPSGLGSKSTCGECNPALNSINPISTTIKFPFSNFGINITKTWPRKQNIVDCQKAKVNNNDISKFASAGTLEDVSGFYWCSPIGECEIQNELIPGWIKYWTKKAIGVFAVYQAVHAVLQTAQVTQGGEEVDVSGSISGGTDIGEGGTIINNNIISVGGSISNVIPTPFSITCKLGGGCP